MSTELKRIIEALIFVADGPINRSQLAQVLDNQESQEINQALEELKQEYENSAHAFSLVEVGGGFSFRTRAEYAFWLRKLKRTQATRMSRAAMETLAIVAYRQPIMRAEVEKMRGVDAGSILRMLMEKDLVRIVGREDLPGRPLIYGTTKKFLEVFNLNDLSDLPTLDELKALAPMDEEELIPELADEDALPSLQEVEAMAREEEKNAFQFENEHEELDQQEPVESFTGLAEEESQ